MGAKAKAPSTRVAPNPHSGTPRDGAHPKGHTPTGASKQAGEVAPAHNPHAGAGGLGQEHVIEIQRSRILAAMVEISAERGAANVTVAHIVERAGVSRRTFYELYSDREECFLGAFDAAIARASRYVLDGYRPEARWAERLRTALTGLLTFLTYERGAGQLLVVGSLGAGAPALERRGRVLAQIFTLVDQGRTETKAGAELPPLTAEGIVGGVLSVLHSRLLAPRDGGLACSLVPRHGVPPAASDSCEGDPDGDSLLHLTGPLMSMIVLPYLGAAAARRELARPVPASLGLRKLTPADPLRDVQMRLTYRTVRVLMAVAALGGRGSHPSNREVGLASDMQDQGQISKLLTRLSRLGLIENTGAGLARGAPNAWMLTPKGQEIERAIGEGATG
jgi:AcrR family transcriptional regulator